LAAGLNGLKWPYLLSWLARAKERNVGVDRFWQKTLKNITGFGVVYTVFNYFCLKQHFDKLVCIVPDEKPLLWVNRVAR
jgi:hypothetical protein